MNKPKIVISIPSLWSVRNFLYTNFVIILKQKYEIEFLIPENSDYLEAVRNTGCEYHIYPVKKFSIIERIFSRALNRKLLNRSDALRKSKLVLLSMNYPPNMVGYFLHYSAIFLQIFFTENFLFRFYILMVRDKRFNELINEITKSPNAIFMATNIVVKHELFLFMNLAHLNNIKIDFINSFDNTTSRGFLPFRIFDKHLVWNRKMKDELMDIFFIEDSKIEISGTPQFDLLKEGGDTKLDKNDYLYSIVENESYIVYCAGHVDLFPFEKRVVKKILNIISTNHPDLKIIVRLHPLDQHQLWFDRFKDNDEIIFDIPWKQNENNPLLSVPKKNQYLRHGRLLNKALLVLNLGSTTSLDSCVLNRPVYNIYFDEFNNNSELDLIYESEHYAPIMESGAAPGIKNTDELLKIISFLKRGIEISQLSDKRKKLAESYCGFSFKDDFISRFDRYISNLN